MSGVGEDDSFAAQAQPTSSSQNLNESLSNHNNLESKNEVDRLSKLNFNMKLRIFYLEERLQKLTNNQGLTNDDIENENLDLKMLVEEKQQELDDRNLLLVKARNAIEQMQTDLTLCKAELAEQRNQRVPTDAIVKRDKEIERLKVQISSKENQYQQRISDLSTVHAQLKHMQEKIDSQEQRLSEFKQKEEGTNSQFESYQTKMIKLQNSINILEQSRAQLQESNKKLDADLKEKDEKYMSMISSFEENQKALIQQDVRLQQEKELNQRLRRELEIVNRSTLSNGDEAIRLRNELSDITNQRDDAIRSNAEMEQTMEAQGIEICTMKELIKAQKKKYNFLTKDFDEQANLLKALTAEKETLEKEHDDSKLTDERKVETYESQLSQKIKEIQEGETRIAHLEESLQEIKEQLKMESEKFESLNSEFLNQGQELYSLRQENAIYKERLNSTRRESDVKQEHLRFQVQTVSEDKIRHINEKLEQETKMRLDLEEKLKLQLDKAKDSEDAFLEQIDNWENGIIAELKELLNPKWSNNMNSQRQFLFDMQSSKHNFKQPTRIFKMFSNLTNIRNSLHESTADIVNKHKNELLKMEKSVSEKENRIHSLEAQTTQLTYSLRALKEKQRQTESFQRDVVEKHHSQLLQALREERQHAVESCRIAEDRASKANNEKIRLEEQLNSGQSQIRLLENNVKTLQSQLDSSQELRSKADQSNSVITQTIENLRENNRIMSLELQERGNKLDVSKVAEEKLKRENERMDVELKQTKDDLKELRQTLEATQKQVRSRDKRLKEYAKKVNETVNVYNKPQGGSDEFEETILKQVHETEQAIMSSAKALARENVRAPGPGSVIFQGMQKLKDNEERFADIMVALAELVQRTEDLFVRLNDSNRTFSKSEDLGFDIQALHRRLSIQEKSNQLAGYKLSTSNVLESKYLPHQTYRPISRTSRQSIELLNNEHSSGRNRDDILHLREMEFRPEVDSPRSSMRHISLNDLSSHSTAGNSLNYSSASSTVGKLHLDMLARLGKIGNDLQATATQLQKNG